MTIDQDQKVKVTRSHSVSATRTL